MLAALHRGGHKVLRDNFDHSSRVDEHKWQRVRLRAANLVAKDCGKADLPAGGDWPRQVWRG